MYKKSFLLLLATIFITSGYAQSKENSSQWHTKEFQQADNISLMSYLYDKDSQLFYVFTNDKENLYLHLKVNSEETQKQILMEGLDVSIKTKVKGKKKLKISYPLSMKERMQAKGKPEEISDNESGEQSRGQMGRPSGDQRPEMDLGQVIGDINNIKLSGFSGDSELIPAISEDYITGNIFFGDEGVLFYTLTIPFESLGLDYHIKTLNIAISSGKNSSSDSSQSGPGGMSGDPGGMGGGPGGGMGGGSGMGGGGMSGPQSKENSVTISIKVKKLGIAHQ